MPIIHECSEPGCCVLTMGLYCVEHEQAGERAEPAVASAAAVGTPDAPDAPAELELIPR